MKKTVLGLIFGAVLTAVLLYIPKFNRANAQGCPGAAACCAYMVGVHNNTRSMVTDWHNWQRLIVFGTAGTATTTGTARLGEHEVFLLQEMFFNRILPAMMMMTEQFVNLMSYQMMIVGTFFDAKQQLQAQALYQKLASRAHKDYHPSFEMCMFGTNTRSIAAAEYNADFTRLTMNERYLDRQLGNWSSVGGGSPSEDRFSSSPTVPTLYNRLGYFLMNTCDRSDLNKEPGRAITGLHPLCRMTVGTGWMNRDIDFTHTVMAPRNINVDFKDTRRNATDNTRVLEMANYLYGHKTRERIQASVLRRQKNQSDLLSDRAITAKRSVAQNSFNALIGLKSRGTRDVDPGARPTSSEGTSEYMHFILQELGISPNQQEYWNYLSQKEPGRDFPAATDPERNEMSYYAQMEILAKRIYQRPEFYTNLYDKPANVKRKAAALQAIGLMLERDIYDSYLRSEAILSMILEARLMTQQHKVENVLEQLVEESK